MGLLIFNKKKMKLDTGINNIYAGIYGSTGDKIITVFTSTYSYVY